MKSEYDLLRKEEIPEDLIQMMEEVLDVHRKLWEKEIYLKNPFNVEWAGEGYRYNIAGNRYKFMTKAALDEDYTKYLANEHPDNVKMVIDNPDYKEAEYGWNEDTDELTIVSEAVGEKRISIKADVVEIKDPVGMFSCEAADAFAAIFGLFGMVRVLKSDGRIRAYVCLGNHGFIAPF